ncbi:hypothetical protein GCM10027026_06480 [Myroides odoratimimus subsp. xuanwuensis]
MVIQAALYAAWWVRFGEDGSDRINGDLRYLTAAWVIGLVWWLLLKGLRAQEPAVLGTPEELPRVLHATFTLFGALAITALVANLSFSRHYLLLTAVFGCAGLAAERWLWRRWLRRERRVGRAHCGVLILGTTRSARRVATAFAARPELGYRVTGVLLTDQEDEPTSLHGLEGGDHAIPVFPAQCDVTEVVRSTEADTVLATSSEQLGPDGLNDLLWQLHPLGVELLVSPNVVGVSQPRLHLREVGSQSFVHVEAPRYSSSNQTSKRAFDLVFASVALLVLWPVLLAAAVAVRLSGTGPALQRVERLGSEGERFGMWRFATSRPGADVDAPRANPIDLDGLEQIGEPDNPRLLADAHDPRITRVGAFLDRSSIRELPQLFNVLTGDMSVVGPRPGTPGEAGDQSELAQRRLLVKQGMTGTWQVSGRTDMSWDEAVKLDLEYVENWSMLRDLGIVWRTFRLLLVRTLLLRRVSRMQADLQASAPDSRVRLRVDSRGRLFLNAYPLFSSDSVALIEHFDSLLSQKRPALVVTANVDQLLDLERESATGQVYAGADLIVIDGQPVVQLARMLGAADVHRHTGADLLPMVAEHSATRGWRVSVLGGAPGVAERASAQLRERYPNSQVSAVEFPIVTGVEDEASLPVIEELTRQAPDAVFVCLGAPKQELWFLHWRDRLPPAVYVGAGAAVDFAAGAVSRAPRVVQRVGGEWVWRLAQEPRRLAGRYLLKGPRFALVIARSMRRGPVKP